VAASQWLVFLLLGRLSLVEVLGEPPRQEVRLLGHSLIPCPKTARTIHRDIFLSVVHCPPIHTVLTDLSLQSASQGSVCCSAMQDAILAIKTRSHRLLPLNVMMMLLWSSHAQNSTFRSCAMLHRTSARNLCSMPQSELYLQHIYPT
jgi:hypothetical protein